MIAAKHIKQEIQADVLQRKPEPTPTSSGKVVKCGQCSKEMRKDSLSRHLRHVHKGSKDLQEPTNKETQKSVANVSSLVVKNTSKDTYIAKSTSKETMKKCKICFTFVRARAFNMHLKKAHSGKTEKCKICYLKFKRKEHMKRHMKNIHATENHMLVNGELDKSLCTFKCSVCTLSFVSENVVKYHTKTKHGSGSEKCQDCDRFYPNTIKLKQHITRAHVIKKISEIHMP